MNPKLRAFTLIELVVVMLLMGIVMLLAYNGLQMIQKLYNDYEKKKQEQLQLSHFFYLFDRDFRESAQFIDDQDQWIFLSEKDTIYYNLTPTTIIRSQHSRSDTFPYIVDSHSCHTDAAGNVATTCSFIFTINLKLVEIQVRRMPDGGSLFN